MRGGSFCFRVTIEARAEQCGSFTNTARAQGEVATFEPGVGLGAIVPFAVEDTEEITVECGAGGAAPGAARGGGGGRGPVPLDLGDTEN